jgi:hypothetical protein
MSHRVPGAVISPASRRIAPSLGVAATIFADVAQHHDVDRRRHHTKCADPRTEPLTRELADRVHGAGGVDANELVAGIIHGRRF